MKLKNVLTLSATSMALLLLVGCAKNYVQENVAVINTNMPKPSSVLIYNFAVNPDDVKNGTGILATLKNSVQNTTPSQEEAQLAREVSDAMATELTQKIAAMGLNPVRANQSTRVTAGSIIIAGAFVNIDEGNSTRRNVIGLGMGQSSLDSKVSVLTTDNQELLSFDAHADSGSMPGAAVMGPAGAAAGAGTAAIVATNVASGGVKSYKSASAQQAKKMADNIAAQLQSYFAQQGWINP
ncbi:MAG: DUF4410 domain-containing protein [Methylococcales bacterium]|nr:DUF4410 domain-containing protein [Methylococcales bacterium]